MKPVIDSKAVMGAPWAAAFCCLPWLWAGCGDGSRFVLHPTREWRGAPDRVGLAFEQHWVRPAQGPRLHAWLVPASPRSRRVLYFHGDTANISHCLEVLSTLNELGLTVFLFDDHGYGRSHGSLEREGDLYADGRAALAHVSRLGWNPQDLVYCGRSLGAAPALQLAVEQPPAGLVIESASTSMAEIGAHRSPIGCGWFGR